MIVPEMFHVKHSLQGRTVAAALLLWSALVACSPPDEMAAATATSAQAATATAIGDDGGAGSVVFADNAEKDGAKREFSYAWPAKAAAIPALAAELEQMRQDELAHQKQSWTSGTDDCPPGSTICRNLLFELEWEVVTDTSRFLSLSKSVYDYSGGGHGNYWRGGYVWDREDPQSGLQDTITLFTSIDDLDAAIGEAACKALSRERAKRRGGAVQIGDWPNQCVVMEDDTVVFLGSSNGRSFDRIGIYYAPYIAGPYAEGEFEFTLPVTPQVLAAVKPTYKSAFALTK